MAIYSDMNSFPESGFPVLSDVSDRIVLNALYTNPLKPLGFVVDVVGSNRLYGNLTIAGALSGATTIGMSGALSGATDISMGGSLTGVTDLGMSGSLGSIMARVNKGWFKDLEIKNTPTVNGEPIALISDISRCFNAIDVVDASLMEYQGIVDDMQVNLNVSTRVTIGTPTVVDGYDQLYSAGNDPGFRQEVQRTYGGAAFDMFRLQAHKTSAAGDALWGRIGAFGTFGADGVAGDPEVTYMYFGVGDDTAYNNTNIKLYPDKSTVIVGNLGLFGNTAVGQRLKANYNNWATLADVVQALVDLHLFDQV